MDNVILFDVGTNASVLNEDIQSLGFDPARVKDVLISHEHQNKAYLNLF